jgi:hypothetical protein
MFDRFFLAHPRSVGESYFEHQRTALSFAIPLLGAACACFVHAFLPTCFERTGSTTVRRLYGRMIVHRNRVPFPPTKTAHLVREDGAPVGGRQTVALASPGWDVGL